MPLDAHVLAAEVALAIKGAIGPVIERMAAAEARLAVLGDIRDRVVVIETKMDRPVVVPEPALAAPVIDHVVLERMAAAETRLSTIGDLRDRVVVLETKAEQSIVTTEVAAVPLPPAPVTDVVVLERLTAAETRLATLGDLRDRVVVMETKSGQPLALPALDLPPVDLGPVLERMAATEARLFDYGDLRDRVVAVEMKAAAPVPAIDLSDVRERLIAIETKSENLGFRVVGLEATATPLATVSERVAVLETRAPVPGPAGKDGAHGVAGTDGVNGKDGVDGVGFDDLMVEQRDDRSFTIKAARGERVKDIGTATFPVQIQRGVYIEGKSYEVGDVATFGGSQWHCNGPTTTKPGEGSKDWTLVVKRGRDGKDGRDGHDAVLPVVSVGKR